MIDTSKVIHAPVGGGRYTVTAPIVKEDYGLYLLIEGLELPTTYEVDFSNSEHNGTSVTMIGNSDGVLIPSQFISSGKDVFAFLYHVGADYGRTVYKFRIPNKLRPDRTEETPTPEEQSVIDQAISALNTAVAKTAQDVESADQSARSASDDADRAESARTAAETAQGKAEEAQESAERAKGDAETSERNASESERKAKGYAENASEKADSIHSMTASAQTLPAGSSASASYNAETGVMSFGIPKGKDGTDGDDGYSPTANVSKTGKVATITITDKNGTTSAQVEDGTDGIDGISPSVSVTDITGGHRVVITDKDGAKSFNVEDGATGATPNLTIGTVETLEPTESATATITGTPENPVLNLGIPQGDAGEVTLDEFYKAFPTDTASGSIASFSDGADDLPLKSLVVDINPIQDLSHGDPSPENICPISGWTQVDVNHSDADMTNPTIITIDLGQTVYGGKLDVLTGILTVYPEYDSYNGETLTGRWISDRDVYASGTTPTIGAQVVNVGAEGTEIQLEPHEVASLLGANNIFADTGDTSAEYRADTKLYIEKLTQPTEDDMVANSAIASDQFFMVGNSLYKALTAIASGATITVGTNAQRVSLADALNLINT